MLRAGDASVNPTSSPRDGPWGLQGVRDGEAHVKPEIKPPALAVSCALAKECSAPVPPSGLLRDNPPLHPKRSPFAPPPKIVDVPAP